jgi:CheY-like chemotaxis protein
MNEHGSSARRFNVLLVEDSEDDVLITKHAFKKLPVAVDFQVARDGLEALQWLRRDTADCDAQSPDLILLDLNLPRMDGRKLLSELKQDEHLKVIPTIILTTSAADDDVDNAYRNHASAYITKPIDLQEFAYCTEQLAGFWLSGVATLPFRGKHTLAET